MEKLEQNAKHFHSSSLCFGVKISRVLICAQENDKQSIISYIFHHLPMGRPKL